MFTSALGSTVCSSITSFVCVLTKQSPSLTASHLLITTAGSNTGWPAMLSCQDCRATRGVVAFLSHLPGLGPSVRAWQPPSRSDKPILSNWFNAATVDYATPSSIQNNQNATYVKCTKHQYRSSPSQPLIWHAPTTNNKSPMAWRTSAADQYLWARHLTNISPHVELSAPVNDRHAAFLFLSQAVFTSHFVTFSSHSFWPDSMNILVRWACGEK